MLLSNKAIRGFTVAGRAFDATLLKNVISLVAVQGGNYLFPLITLPYLVRVLGPSDYGRIGFAAAFVQYFVLMTDFGFNLSATKSIATVRHDRQMVSRIFWSTITSKAVLCCFGAVVLVAATLLVPKLGAEREMLFITYLTVVGTVLFPIWLFQGLEKMGFITICSFAARAAVVPLIFIFVRTHSDILVAAAMQSGTGVLAGVISLWLLRRQSLVSWVRPSIADVREGLRESWPLFLSVAAISLYTNSNVVLLGFLASNQAVGQFVAVDKIRQALQALINPISQAFYPRICSLMATAPESAYRLIHRVFIGQGVATFAISMVLAIFAGPIIALILGAKFHGAVDTLRLLAFLPFAIGLSNVFGIQTMVPLGMTRTVRNVVVGSGLLNVLLLIPLSLRYADRGAAGAVLITEIAVTLVMALILLHKKVPIFWPKEPALEV